MNAKLIAGLLVGMFGASAAQALVIDRVSGYYSGNGGEFTVDDPTAAAYAAEATAVNRYGNTGFQTFCLEMNEYIGIPATYNYTTPVGVTTDGGRQGPDTISVGTAWLYSQFASGTLDDIGYNYTPGANRAASAAALQNAIWYLEEELTSAPVSTFLTKAIDHFGDLAAARASVVFSPGNPQNDTTLGVRVINLVSNGGQTHNQSQLYYTGPSYQTVADGGLTFLMLGASMAGFSLLRRRLAK